ncbi:MAG: aldolase/citrate lyase family protein, partial [Chloroflexota bacterium]|nr:aldolase/citrate lyase family protein [Chloroflexota bacterium]
MSNLRQNKAKKNLSDGKIVSVPMGPMNGDLIEHFGPLGFDAMWLEGEHGPVDFNNIPDLTRACDLWDMTPIVRVHQNEPATIYRTFDLGAQAITVPHINTKEEALSVVDSGKFAPIGNRGSFTSRQGIGVDDYFSQANDQTMLIILIEDIIAVNNLDEIL